MLAAFAACGDDNNEPNQPVTPPDPDPIVDKTPVYETITTDIVVEEYSTYADEWKTIFPKKSVINTNPDTIVADSILARMSKEENERLDKMSSDETYVGEIAMELNGHRLECTAFYYYYPEYNYLPKTRIELINNYCKSNFLEAVLISFDKSVKHDLDECNLYHSFCGFSKEFVIDGQPSEVFQP